MTGVAIVIFDPRSPSLEIVLLRVANHAQHRSERLQAINMLEMLGTMVNGGKSSISVIIPHYNDLAGLQLLIQSLDRQTLPREQFEIVIADNNSACGVDAVRLAAPRARVVPAAEQGAGPARNAAIAASTGTILAFIDSDCVAEPDWLEAGVQGLEGHDFIGGSVLTTARDPAAPAPVEAYEIVFNFDFKRYITRLGFTGSGNMFARRDVVEAVGGFGTGVSEDMEWSFRARGMGYRLGYVPEARVSHPARPDWPALRRRWERLTLEHYLLARQKPLGVPLHAVKALAMPLSIAPHAWRVLRHPRLPGWRARLGAITVLARLRVWRMQAMLRRSLRGPVG